jgi:alpha-L-arabinofuranosidase
MVCARVGRVHQRRCHDLDEEMARRKRHPAPYPVKFWGVGNEPWGDYQMGAVSPLDMGLLAAAHVQEGSLSRAEECIERLHQLAERQYVTPLAESFAAVGMGDFDLALQSLDEAINHKTDFVNLLAIHLIVVPLRILLTALCFYEYVLFVRY